MLYIYIDPFTHSHIHTERRSTDASHDSDAAFEDDENENCFCNQGWSCADVERLYGHRVFDFSGHRDEAMD